MSTVSNKKMIAKVLNAAKHVAESVLYTKFYATLAAIVLCWCQDLL